MKFLVSAMFLLSLNVLAYQSYELSVGNGLKICEEDFCSVSNGISSPIEIELNDQGYGQYWLKRQLHKGMKLDQWVSVLKKSDLECSIGLHITWTTDDGVHAESASITCEEFERARFERLDNEITQGKSFYTATLSIHKFRN